MQPLIFVIGAVLVLLLLGLALQLPETLKRAMAKQAEAEREKRAKIISAELGNFLAREQAATMPVPAAGNGAGATPTIVIPAADPPAAQ